MPKKFSLTQQEQSLLPSEEDIQFYEEHGYYISPQIISDDLLDAVLVGVEAFCNGKLDEGPFVSPKHLPQGDTQTKLGVYAFASLRCNMLNQLRNIPIIAATAARLARVNELRLFRDHLFTKPPRSTSQTTPTRVGWHRDYTYWKFSTSTDLLTAWIPFTSVNEEMGTLQVIPGSHKWAIEEDGYSTFHDQNMEKYMADLSEKGLSTQPIPIILERGQVSFHHCNVIHGSSENLSNRSRQALGIHFQEASNRYKQDYPEKLDYGPYLARKDAHGNPDFTDPAYCPILWQA